MIVAVIVNSGGVFDPSKVVGGGLETDEGLLELRLKLVAAFIVVVIALVSERARH